MTMGRSQSPELRGGRSTPGLRSTWEGSCTLNPLNFGAVVRPMASGGNRRSPASQSPELRGGRSTTAPFGFCRQWSLNPLNFGAVVRLTSQS